MFKHKTDICLSNYTNKVIKLVLTSKVGKLQVCFTIFVLISTIKVVKVVVFRAEIATTFGPKMVLYSNFRTQYKSIQNLQTLQGYIFRILQHFATKLCKFTNFSMLFLAVVLYLHPLA